MIHAVRSFYSTNFFFLTILVGCFFQTSVVSAQTRNIQVQLGKTNEITVAPGETTKSFNLSFFSKTSETSTLSIDLKAPNKSVLSARAIGFKKVPALPSGVAQIGKGYVIELAAFNGRFTKSLTVGGGSSSSGGSNGSGAGATICKGYSLAIYKPYYVETFKSMYGRAPTSEEDLCDGIFGDAWRAGSESDSGNNGSTSSNYPSGSLNATAHILKDACNKTNKYLVVLTLDVSKIAASERAAGYTLSISLEEKMFSGGTQASLKPVSEGKYAPNPLLLTALITGQDKHMYTRWSNGSTKKMLSSTTKSIVKITPWRAFLLGASIPNSELRGGKMTVITFDNQSAYGVCFSASRTRQRYNGYPAD